LVVDLSVVEFVVEGRADLEAIIRRNGHITAVEKTVDVGAQQESVWKFIWAAFLEWFDVGGIEGGEGVFARYGASVVGVLDGSPEKALPESGVDQIAFAVSCAFVDAPQVVACDRGERHHGGTFHAFVPDAASLTVCEVVGFTGYDLVFPVGGAANPQGPVEKDGTGQQDASDDVMAAGATSVRALRVSAHPLYDPFHVGRTVRISKQVPRIVHRQLLEECEETESYNGVSVVGLELENQGLAPLEHLEGLVAGGLPEIGLLRIGLPGEVGIPFVIRRGDVAVHGWRSGQVSQEFYEMRGWQARWGLGRIVVNSFPGSGKNNSNGTDVHSRRGTRQ